MAVQPVPDGFHTVTPYLIVRDAASALEFYKKAFGAVETLRHLGPTGKVMHAQIRVGSSPLMLSEEFPDVGTRGPQSLGGTAVFLYLYVEDADSWYQRAVAAGAQVVRPLNDEFYGDRAGTVGDPFGHVWTIASRKEDLTPEETQRRLMAFMGPASGG